MYTGRYQYWSNPLKDLSNVTHIHALLASEKIIFWEIMADVNKQSALTYPHTYFTSNYTQMGRTALHAAVEGDHEDVVQLLLEANIDPDLPDKVNHVTCGFYPEFMKWCEETLQCSKFLKKTIRWVG